MKRLSHIVILLLIVINCQAQNKNTNLVKDSNRVINLDEVTLITKQNVPQRRLVNFFKANNASTLEDILSRLPELSLTRRGAYGMDPAIRSFNGGQINVLVDGMRIHGACTDKMDPVTIYIEPINLETLELQTASNGFSSGSSIGGTINMKIAEPDYLNNKKVTGIISSGYQTAAKSFYESIRLNYATGKWAMRASATYRHNSNYRSGGGEKINFSQYEKINYSLSVKYLQGAYNFIRADVLMDDGWNIGYPALPMDVGYAGARIGSLSFVHENRQKHLAKFQLKGYANQVHHYMDDTHRPDVPMHMDMPGESKTIGLYSEAEIIINKKQSMMLRADASSTFLKASMTMYQPGQLPMYMLTWPDNKKNQFGLSSSWVLQKDSTTKWQLNARIDFIRATLTTEEAKSQVGIFGFQHASKNNVLKNGSVQFTKKISSTIKANASIAYTERVPTASERYGFYLFNSNDGYDYIGNPQLQPEESLQAEISASYNPARNKVQLSLFYSRISHFISSITNNNVSTMTIGAHGVKTYNNIPHAFVSGLEASCFLKPFQKFDFVSTLRYTYAQDYKDEPLPGIAPLKNVSSIRYQPNKIFYQVETEMAAAQNRIRISSGEDETKPYTLWHVRLGLNSTLFQKNIEIQTGIENIFDKNYHEHLDWGNIARPGRNAYLQIKMMF